MTDRALVQFLTAVGVKTDHMIVTDRRYALPTEQWFFGAFPEACRKNLALLGLDKYVPEANDCDNFARLTADMALIAHRQSSTAKAGFAVGVFAYQPYGTNGAHAIVFAVAKTATGHRLLFIEPQTQQQVRLNATELACCLYLYV